ncbi:Neutral protease 2-like protein [Phlyctema vagabunda]|uniref:Neutral protease 2 n=1 Tax=Phlyctema vagabunda TaxID=108571 RepID=A0ABR4PPU9_9HELO
MYGLTKVTLALATLASLGSSTRLDLEKRDTPLAVELTAGSNAVVKATVTNTGLEPLTLLAYGNILDSAPVPKLLVSGADSTVDFTGIYKTPARDAIGADKFITLAAGETFETEIDTATVHDFTSTGTYSFVAEGAINFATADKTAVSTDAVYFKSNVLTMEVDAEAAKAVEFAISPSKVDKRTVLQSGCSTAQRTATTRALSNCASLARAAASAASSGSATKFSEYFKSTAASVRSTVAARLTAVASQCSSTTSGATDYYCTDVYGYCDSNTLAYTIPSQNLIVNCPIYYSLIPALTSTCHAQDQATTTLHEMTHAPGVYSPGTADNGYGYAAATALTSARAVLNADSYALYANAIYVGC